MNQWPIVPLSLAATLLLIGPSAHAQDGTSGFVIEEVVVTARKKEENVQEVPLAVTALTGNALEQRNVVQLKDISAFTPNLQIVPFRGDSAGVTFGLRGQRQGGLGSDSDASVGVYLDGVSQPRGYSNDGALLDLNRVEVLRGPQGTLFGRNTTGGAISMFSNDPEGELGGSIRAEIGNFDTLKFTGILNAPLGDTAGIRLVAHKNQRDDGFGTDLAGNELMSEDSEYFRMVFLADPNDRTMVRLTASYYENDTGGGIQHLYGYTSGADAQVVCSPQSQSLPIPGCLLAAPLTGVDLGALFAGDPSAFGTLFGGIPNAIAAMDGFIASGMENPYDALTDSDSFGDSEVFNASLTFEYDLTDTLTLRSITGYVDTDKLNFTDNDGTPVPLITSSLDQASEFFSQEIELLGTAERFDWVAGVYYGSEQADDVYNNTFLTMPLPPAADSDIDNSTRAVFGQANWLLADQWTLTAGYRHTWDKKKSLLRQTNVRLSDKWNDNTWLVSLQYQANDEVLLYGKIARGYRAGGLQNNKFFQNGFDPETALEYEVGLKSDFDLGAGSLRINSALYVTDYQDIQLGVIASAINDTGALQLFTVDLNAAEATVFGWELEARYVLDRFTADVTIGLTDAEYDEFIDDGGPMGAPRDRSDEPFSEIPKWSYTLGLSYFQPLGMGALVARVDYAWMDDTVSEPQPAGQGITVSSGINNDSYGLLNARVTLELDSIGTEVALFASNLTDEEYTVTGTDLRQGAGLMAVVPGFPRTYGLSITKRFGEF